MSKMIHVRNVPDRLHRELKRRAAGPGSDADRLHQGATGMEVASPPAEDVFQRIAGREPVGLGRPASELIREEPADREAS